MKRDDLAGLIYDLLVDAPDGLTVYEIAAKIDLPVPAIRKAMRSVRLTLGEDDTLFVIAEPQGLRMPWLYKLVDGSTLVDTEESGWAYNRINDSQSRVHLLAVAMATAERATDGRTTEGRKARLLAKVLRRLDEDLLEIDSGS